MAKTPRILVVSEDETQRNSIREALEERNFAVQTVVDGAAANEEFAVSSFDLVVISVAGADEGVAFVRQMRSRPELADTLLLVFAEWGTGQATPALAAGANAYEPGPIDAERLLSAVARLLRQRIAVVE